jgi:hypothetical protein
VLVCRQNVAQAVIERPLAVDRGSAGGFGKVAHHHLDDRLEALIAEFGAALAGGMKAVADPVQQHPRHVLRTSYSSAYRG